MRVLLISLLLWIVSLPAAAGNILVVGDSLSAAYGLPGEQGWVSLLEQRLKDKGLDWQVVNASISGDTSGGGLSRLPPLLETHRPTLVIIALGSNDGLRALPLASLRSNLQQMITLSQQQGAQVLLPGMAIPPNYGPRYTEGFAAIYTELRQQFGLAEAPILLEQVALDHRLMLADNLHPNAEGQRLMLETLWPVIRPLLDSPPAK
ncbi:MAG: arylesterase [Thiohalomonadaceae bacterium]